ncbi:hypothetical protein IT087_01680, partial [Candidatus Uhrbacteria bacterium]|nr:hypothetical protein [Candidatus Uhrbacteria bacterium]
MDIPSARRILIAITVVGAVGALLAAIAIALQPEQPASNKSDRPIISFDLDAAMLPSRVKDILNNAVASAVENFKPEPGIARECEVSLNSDTNVPLSDKYRYSGVMGALFTAFECGDSRAESVFDYLGLSDLKQDLEVDIRYMPQRPEVYRALEDMGFVCEKSLNSSGAVLYEGWCEISKGKNL